ncbi:MAG: oxidoreductase [Frankiales bacterium]|nr:oxidoreductase [Frankiales bacterium]
MKVGLVGAGPWARMFTGPLVLETEGLELAGVWARRPEAAAELGWGTFGSYDELLASCDAVAFAVPPDIQSSMAPVAARAGKHLLLDKPIARDVAAAEALAEAVAEAGVVSQVALTNRFVPTTRAFLDEMASADIANVCCRFITSAVLEGSVYATPWRVAEPHGLLDLGPHAFDLVLALAGAVAEVVASEHLGVLSARLAHESGVVSDVTLSAVTPDATGPLAIEVVTAAGRAVLPPKDQEAALASRAIFGQEFVQAVRGTISQPIDVHRGLEVQRLLERVQRAL